VKGVVDIRSESVCDDQERGDDDIHKLGVSSGANTANHV
jgi:hypothetical protein